MYVVISTTVIKSNNGKHTLSNLRVQATIRPLTNLSVSSNSHQLIAHRRPSNTVHRLCLQATHPLPPSHTRCLRRTLLLAARRVVLFEVLQAPPGAPARMGSCALCAVRRCRRGRMRGRGAHRGGCCDVAVADRGVLQDAQQPVAGIANAAHARASVLAVWTPRALRSHSYS